MNAALTSPRMRETGATLELRVLSGLHRGAVLELDDESADMSIGASSHGDVDVMLADPGVAERHCCLRRLTGCWSLEPVGGQVTDRRGRAVVGAVAIVSGQVFRLAEVWIGFSSPNDPWPQLPGEDEPIVTAVAGRYPRVKASVAVAVFVVTALPATWLVSTAWGGVDDNTHRVGPVEAQAMQPVPESPPSPAKLVEEFTRELSERDLKDRLDLQIRPDRWEIRGSLEPDERLRLERLLVRFTANRRPDVLIRVILVSPADLLPFKVIEVSAGKTSFIVTDSGERLQLGEVYQGWRLVSVESSKAVFDGRQRVEISL